MTTCVERSWRITLSATEPFAATVIYDFVPGSAPDAVHHAIESAVETYGDADWTVEAREPR